jgi:hypothetical protein
MTPSGMNNNISAAPFQSKVPPSSGQQQPTQSTPLNAPTTTAPQNKDDDQSDEEEVKIPILFNNFEGFEDKQSAH